MSEDVQELFNDWENVWLSGQGTIEALEPRAKNILAPTLPRPVFCYNWWNELGMGDKVTATGLPKSYSNVLHSDKG